MGNAALVDQCGWKIVETEVIFRQSLGNLCRKEFEEKGEKGGRKFDINTEFS